MENDAHSAQDMFGQLKTEHEEYIYKKDALEKQKQFIDADCILGAAMMV